MGQHSSIVVCGAYEGNDGFGLQLGPGNLIQAILARLEKDRL